MTIKKFFFPITAMFFALAISPAGAYQSQSQSMDQSIKMEINAESSGTSSVTAKASAHQSAQQSQSQGVDWNGYPVYAGGWEAAQVEPTYGAVYLSWNLRGGTCHVRYTESNQNWYKYATATACDNGGVTIGGLVPGRWYRFQVRQDNGYWLKAITRKAS